MLQYKCVLSRVLTQNFDFLEVEQTLQTKHLCRMRRLRNQKLLSTVEKSEIHSITDYMILH